MADGDRVAITEDPKIRIINWRDIVGALIDGFLDFRRAPKYGLFFGAFFSLGGLAILAFLTFYNSRWMIVPIAVGFPLAGPFLAAGIYEVSRRLSAGRVLNWRSILVAVFRQRERQMAWLALLVVLIFWIWLYLAQMLATMFMGKDIPVTLGSFVDFITMSEKGIAFLVVGTLVGAILAFLSFASTIIAMPLLLETDIRFFPAIRISFAAVFRNPIPMIGWGIIVTLLVFAAMLPAFLGLIIVFPVLGHATWHLYTRTIVRIWSVALPKD